MNDAWLSYVISSLAPDDINAKMWEVRKRFNVSPLYEKRFQNSVITVNHAHTTLKRRFYLKSPVAEEQLVAAIDKVVKQPLTITINKLAILQMERQGTSVVGNVIAGMIEKTPEIQKLHEDLVKSITPFVETEKQYEGHDYNPHISIAYSVPGEMIQEIMEYTEKYFLPVTYTMHSFSVLKNIGGITRERSIVKTYTF